MRLIQEALTCRSWRWAAVLAMVLGGAVACGGGGGGPTPPELVDGLELFAGLPRSSAPRAGLLGSLRAPLAMDAQGNLYGVVTCEIRRMSPDGVLTTVARLTPNGSCILGNDRFISIDGIAVDAVGNLYIADRFNSVIRKVTPAGVTVVLAGTERAYGKEDGTGPAARFESPSAIAVDATGTVYVTEDQAVRRISPEGVVSTLRRDPNVTSGTTAPLIPVGVAVDSAGSVYTMDSRLQRLLRITPDGLTSVMAGSTRAPSAGQIRDGSGGQALFFGVEAISVDAQGNVYLGDDTTIRKVTPAGVVSTLAGRPGLSDSLDGPAGAARFRRIFALAAEPGSGRLVVSDGDIGLRTVATDGSVVTPGGRSSVGSTDGVGAQARFAGPQGVATDALGNVYVADVNSGTVRKVSGGGNVTTLVGVAALGGFLADGVGPAAHFSVPTSLTFDAAGNLLVADQASGFKMVRRVTPGAVVSSPFEVETDGNNRPGFGCDSSATVINDVAVDAVGSVYFADPGQSIICKFTTEGALLLVAGSPFLPGSANGPALEARFSSPTHLVFDGGGNLYVSDAGNHTVRKISPDGVVSTVAGQAGLAGDSDGVGAAARFSTPGDLALAQDGSVYVADIAKRAVRRLEPDGIVTTLIRAVGPEALGDPTALAIGPGGLLYIADGYQNVLWRVRLP